jgi:Protein of unknown function (DUF4236)
MGWSYRKSVNLGPFRVNISKSGFGYSIGGSGFRTGVTSTGRRYKSYSIPGTGLRYYASGKNSTGCLVGVLFVFSIFGFSAGLWLAFLRGG